MTQSETSLGGRNWSAESFRLTTFHDSVSPFVQDAAGLWELVTGDRPEQVSSRPRENLTLVEGSFAGNRLLFSCRHDRVDWNIRSAPPPPELPAEDFNVMGHLMAHLQPFLELSNTWLRESPGINRLAFGAVLLMPAEGLSAAYEDINQLLPRIEVDSTGSSDFFYQINRPRPSESCEGVLINRLTKWSVMQGGSLGFAIQGNAETQFRLGRDFFACRLELDLNTAGILQNPVAGEEAVLLLAELVTLGKEIAAQGDIP